MLDFNGPQPVSRRTFMATMAGAAVAVSSPNLGAKTAEPGKRWKCVIFSKAFQNLGFEEAADLVAEVGWDGIECPVRQRGQIEPAEAEDRLPELAEVFKKRGLEISMITTDIRNASDPLAEKVLRTASSLGIKRYRMSYWRYNHNRPIPAQLEAIRPELRDLVALNKELGICGAYQNHSGAQYVGAPVWDIYELFKEFDPKHLGVCFDIGHATVEGGYAWPIQARLMEPFYSAIYCKDFVWAKTDDRGWRAQWGPLGEGMVDRRFFDFLKKTEFSGPISQHLEYPLGEGKQRIAAMKKDLATLRSWLEA